jgi:alpha-L-arabinofuranosidase
VFARRSGKDGPLTGKIFIKNVKLEEFIPFTKVPYLSVNASISKDKKTICLMVINKNHKQDIETEIVVNNFMSDGIARTFTLWGDQIDSTNEKSQHNNVRIYEDSISFTGNTFKTKFKKHSLTAIEITGKYE